VIIRILGDRQYHVPEKDLSEIERLDQAMTSALDAGDEAAFSSALSDLVAKVRSSCDPLPDDDDRTSDLVVPHEGASLQEVRDILDAGV
jgi:hypothetical protein